MIQLVKNEATGSDRDPGIQTGGDQPGTFWEPGTRTGRDVSPQPQDNPSTGASDPDVARPEEPDEQAQKELEKGQEDRESRRDNV